MAKESTFISLSLSVGFPPGPVLYLLLFNINVYFSPFKVKVFLLTFANKLLLKTQEQTKLGFLFEQLATLSFWPPCVKESPGTTNSTGLSQTEYLSRGRVSTPWDNQAMSVHM